MLFNKVSYQTEKYTDEVLYKYVHAKNYPISSTNINWLQTIFLRQSFLESEERYLGDGFFPRKAEWIEFYEDAIYNDGWSPDSIMNLSFLMSMDTKQYSRSVYSVLDFLGDVGGLLSILLPIGGAFIALLDWLFDRTLDSYIITKIFFYK